MYKFYTVLVVATFLSGCTSSQYAIQFDSNPQGAMLVCDGKNWGYTPKTLYLPKERIKDKSELSLSNCTATWVSGAQSKYGTIPINQYPDGIRTTAKRPVSPNLDKDIDFALKVQQFKYQQAKDKAAAKAKAWDDLDRSIDSMKSTHTNCYNIGGMISCNSTTY